MQTSLAPRVDNSININYRLICRIAAFLSMLVTGYLYAVPGLSDWDSWDYTSQAIVGQSSDLALGRWWFIASMRLAYLGGQALAGLELLDGYRSMQMLSALMGASALPVAMALAHRLTRSLMAEVLLALLVIAGPVVAMYTPTVMTESMTFLITMVALYAWQRAVQPEALLISVPWKWAILAGGAYGLAIDIREPLILFAAWPIATIFLYRPRKSWALLLIATGAAAIVLGIGVIGAWMWHPWGDFWQGLVRWQHWMQQTRLLIGVSFWRNMLGLVEYLSVSAPALSVLIIPAALWSARSRKDLFVMGLCSLPYAGALLMNHDFPGQPRYVLPLVFWWGAITAAGLLAGVAMVARKISRPTWQVMAVAMFGIIVSAWGITSSRADFFQLHYYQLADAKNRACKALNQLPADSAVVCGQGSAAAMYLNRLAIKRFSIIAHGWQWPKDVRGRIDDELAAGRRVFVIEDCNFWIGHYGPGSEREQLLDALKGYELSAAPQPFVEVRKHK